MYMSLFYNLIQPKMGVIWEGTAVCISLTMDFKEVLGHLLVNINQL